MFTPQQLTEIGFVKAVFGGYDMESVHDVIDPLIEDYTTLYKENAVLKSKLRILVEKLEEYRQQEISMGGSAAAQENAQELIRSAEDKAAQIIRNAQARASHIVGDASSNAKTHEEALALEADRLAQAKQTAASFIQAVEADIHHHLELLDNLKQLEAKSSAEGKRPPQNQASKGAPKSQQPKSQPSKQSSRQTSKHSPKPQASAPQAPAMQKAPRNAGDYGDIAKEIEQNVEKLVGSVPGSTYDASAQDTKPMRPLHPESITAKFGDLQFGKNYNPK